ncbi:MAG: TadE/TadG family type IV pilus assembly protein [Pseudomonadota bacterium]
MSFKRGIGRFARGRRGTTAMMFAGALLGILPAVGFVVDYGMYLNSQNRVQHALDMAGLAAARHLNQNYGSDADTVKTLTREFFKSELQGHDYITMNEVDVVRSGMRLNLEVDGTMPTSLMSLVGVDTMSLYTEAEVVFGTPTKAEIVLVLDTSYSMSKIDPGDTESRIKSLKDAAGEMVVSLVDPDSGVDIKMGVVPFSDRVNVGTDYKSAGWITGTEKEETSSERCFTSPIWLQANCDRVPEQCSNDGVSYSCYRWECHGKQPPSTAQNCTTVTTTKEWHGCVKPRSAENHLTDAGYASEKIPGHLSPNANQCASPMLPLTDVAGDLTDMIEEMEVRNKTYMPTGLIWGLRMLTPKAPFRADDTIRAFAADGGVKTIILMSDGANTMKLGSSSGIVSVIKDYEVGTPAGNKTNEDTSALCTLIKSKGVEIYVVAYGIDDAATTALLKGCASSESRYFEAGSTAQLKKTFEAITQQLGRDVSISG